MMADDPAGTDVRVPVTACSNAGLREAIRAELEVVRRGRETLERPGRFPAIEGLVLLFCLLANIIFFLVRLDYFALFIAASIYLNMFYFVSLLIPTGRGPEKIRKADLKRFLTWIQEIGIKAGTTQFARLFLNSFFINSRTLALGIGAIFTADIFFVIASFLLLRVPAGGTIIVLSQCLAIAVFYFLIWKIEPFSYAFLKNVESMKTKLVDRNIPPCVISALLMVGLAFAVILILITIILLPGITVAAFLTESGLTALAHLMALIAILAASQYFMIRSIHGASSRIMARRLLDYKERTLGGILEAAEPAGNLPQSPYEITTLLLESKIYQVRENTLLGTFPVYVVDLDFSVMLDSTTMTAIRGTIHEE